MSAVGLSKRYAMPSAPGGWLDALADVSFDIQQGEAVGLIGRNGAGKSTLLRILTRVTRPTAGRADVYGTVGALLEVGTGFHPDLTGRENTFLSGAILGLSKAEVRGRFDAIVDFAEIGPFIDTPVKRYSSGMYARLGFAVAAHLRPSILIVDEVLAVGDLAFQAKCLAHMHQLTQNGTSVLFVSHNLLAVADLCQRALLVEAGRLIVDSKSEIAIAEYRRGLVTKRLPADSTLDVRLTMNGAQDPKVLEIERESPLRIELAIDRPADSPPRAVVVNLVVESGDGRAAIHLRSDLSLTALSINPGDNLLAIVVDQLPLTGGSYWAWVRLVGLDPEEPLLWDSDRVELVVHGPRQTDGLVLPAHRFDQRSSLKDEVAVVGVPR